MCFDHLRMSCQEIAQQEMSGNCPTRNARLNDDEAARWACNAWHSHCNGECVAHPDGRYYKLQARSKIALLN
jgi:hypothetical protein